MALRFIDSFEHYSGAQIVKKWTQQAFTNVVSNGRNGNGLSLVGGQGVVSVTIDPQNTWTVGFAVNVPGNFGIGQLYGLGAIDTGRLVRDLCHITLNQDGTLSIYCNSNTLISTSTFSLHSGVWYYIEMTIALAGSPIVTTAELKVNGNVEIASASGSTSIHSTDLLYQVTAANIHSFGAAGGLGNTLMDDIYITDGTGLKNNKYLGDIKILAVYPNGDITTQWTPSRAGTSFDLVNEHVPDDDTTYISSNTINQIDDFNWEDLPAFIGVVKGVQYSIYARKDDEGTRTIKHRVGATTQGPEHFLSDNYVYYRLPLDDDNGVDWSVSLFNAENFGVIVIE